MNSTFKSKGLVLLLVLLSLLAALPARAQQARLSDIVVTNTSEHLIVYFSVEDCYTAEMLQAIESGIPTTFTFYMHLYAKRDFWWDRKIAELEVQHTVTYDPLKKRYEVRLSEKEDEVLMMEDFEEARRLMSEVVGLEVASLDLLEKGMEYQLRLMVELDKIRLPLYLHQVLFFLSLWDFETDWYTVDFLY
ncbi:MAG: DUF4390 domain-containing protein [Desulfobacteraceae bacterium]|jgi:hypothetical protein